MKYMLMLFGDEHQWDGMTDDQMGEVMQGHDDFSAWCEENNVSLLSGEELQPSGTAQSFAADGTITDGPYLEIKEQLGGFYVFEVESAQLAEEVARRCPNYGSVELRPVVE